MSSHQRYDPVNSLHRNDSEHSSYADRESLELHRVERVHSGESTAPLTKSPPPPTSRIFSPNQQTRRLFVPQFLRWLLTVVFVAFMLLTLKIFEGKGNFSKSQKYAFNTIFTALSLGLGLNFFEVFKDIAKVLRWNVLASRSHSIRELDLVLSIESLTKVVELAWESRWQTIAMLACFSWLLLNLAAQAGVAVIGLTFSVDGGTDWKGTYKQQGTVNATSLDCYTDNGKCPNQPQVEQIVAHLYGDMAQGSQCCSYSDISEVYSSNSDCPYFCRYTPNHQEFAYRFSEINPVDNVGRAPVYPRFTNRVITASSGQCYQYDIDTNSGQQVEDLNGNKAANEWRYSNGTVNGSIVLPMAYSAYDSTTYIYRGTDIPEKDTSVPCGPRCMWMWAFKAKSTLPTDQGQDMAVFQCPITISTVSNVNNDTQIVPDRVAKIAASAIGLQGRNAVDSNGSLVWTQYQMYPWGSTWEIHNHQIDEVGQNMAAFALGSLALMAARNPRIQVDGLVPILGSNLSVHWDYVILLCVGIVGVHFALFAAAIYIGRLVVIKDESNLSIARLLRPLVEHLGDGGTLLDGQEMSQVIEGKLPRGIIYGPREDSGGRGWSVLDVGESIRPRKAWDHKRHPDGRYL